MLGKFAYTINFAHWGTAAAERWILTVIGQHFTLEYKIPSCVAV